MKKRYRVLGFEEMGANQTARDLFGHLRPGNKVAITTRFGVESAAPLVRALEARGLTVRVVANQTGVEDFCFLKSAQKELIGIAKSTFFRWAAFLGNCKTVRMYKLDSPAIRKKGGENIFRIMNWTHPDLKKRISFELHKLDS